MSPVQLATTAPVVEDPDAWLAGAPMDPAATPADKLPVVSGVPFAYPGAGIVISGPTGGGRSSLLQKCMADAASAGLRCAYIASEVTQDEFNARAATLARRSGQTVDDELRSRYALVRFLDLPAVILRAWAAPEAWVAGMVDRYDVIGIDPLSGVGATLDLNFDQSNADFVKFYSTLVQPLTSRGLVVLLPDNEGHALEARGRAKGASAKQDVADVTLACKLIPSPAALLIRARKVRSVRAPFSRGDAWIFDRDTQSIRRDESGAEGQAASTFRPTHQMERVSTAIEADPGLSKRAVRDAVGGKATVVDLALEILVAEGFIEARQDGQAVRHYSLRPYREDADRVPVSQPCPNRVPDTGEVTVSTVSHLLRTRDTGHGSTDTADRVPLDGFDPDDELARLEVKLGDDEVAA